MSRLSSKEPFCLPLLKALLDVQRWVEQDGVSRVIVAAPTIGEVRKQRLPDHLKISVKKRCGRRVSMRGKRHSRNATHVLAKWPEDGQESYSVPVLFCVLNGQADLHISDYVLHCQTGDFVLVPPGIAQPDGTRSHIEDGSERSCDLLHLAQWWGSSEGLGCSICHSQGHYHVEATDNGNMSYWARNTLAVQLFHNFKELMEESASPELASHMLSCLVCLMRHEIEQERFLIPGYKPPHQPSKIISDPIQQACDFIDVHLDQTLTIDIVARKVCLSPATFTRKFRLHTGQSFNEYVVAHRVALAASLLSESEWSVNMVGFFAGLKPARLRQLFHQHYDCSPQEFRLRGN